jgi:hypothetical protein
MEKSEKEFSPQESLRLIQSMIETTKSSISDSSHYFLLWGWAVFMGCVLQYILLAVVNYPHHYYAWFITPLALILHSFFIVRDRKRERVKTFINDANNYLWTAIGLSFFVMSFIFSKIGWQYCFPFYILIYGIGTFVSGNLIRFKPLVIGGIVNLVLAIIAAYLPYNAQILMTAFAILVSYIIPGHMLRIYYRKTNLS